MAQVLNKLRSQSLKTLPNGRHGDGGGLYVVVSPKGRSFAFIYARGRRVEMGLGSINIGLATAREMAKTARQQLAAGLDPLTERRKAKPKKEATFGECAAAFIESRRVTWKDPRAVSDWRRTLSLDKDKGGKLKGFCQAIVNRPVADIDTQAVVAVLKPIWRPCGGGKGKPGIVTARSLRDRLELILDFARASNFREGENPARWRGHLEHILPKIKHKKIPHPAMHWSAVPGFMKELQADPTIPSLALQFTLLTTVRTAVTLGAVWSEIDLEGAVWNVPGPRTKSSEPLSVPLSAPAMEILAKMALLRPDDGSDSYVFPGHKPGKPRAPGAMRWVMSEGFAAEEATPHGTARSSFRDWVTDHGHDRDLAELSLHHRVGDETERSYARSTALERRRTLMKAWADHCLGRPQKPAQAVQQAAQPPMTMPVLAAFPAGLKPANAA